MKVLMCKNRKVYNISEQLVLCENLLPGIMLKNPNEAGFEFWQESRYSSNTNAWAMQLIGDAFGQESRDLINSTTRELSLSDCYWITDADDDIKFKNISPYYSEFWKGIGNYEGGAIPTLYVDGFLSKKWADANTLVKRSSPLEVECLELAERLGMNCAKGFVLNKKNIAVYNFTNTNRMLESANVSGFIDPNFFTEEDIIRHLGITGIDMIIIDAIVGNGDRHTGNFGFLRDADTGTYLGPAPIFDFDHALDARGTGRDFLTADVTNTLKESSDGVKRFLELFRRSQTVDMRPVFRERLNFMKSQF